MAIYCTFDCAAVGPVCDFCKHYHFNGDEKGRYTGEGWCNFHQHQIDPEGGCEDFYCQSVDKKEKVNEL